MAYDQRVQRLKEYRSFAARDEETAVGAFARRRRRRNVAIALAGLLLIAGAGWLYRTLLPSNPAVRDKSRDAKVQCVSCGFVGVVRVAPEETFPVKCPKCKARGCNELWTCHQCGREFVPRKSGNAIQCPSCESTDVGAALFKP